MSLSPALQGMCYRHFGTLSNYSITRKLDFCLRMTIFFQFFLFLSLEILASFRIFPFDRGRGQHCRVRNQQLVAQETIDLIAPVQLASLTRWLRRPCLAFFQKKRGVALIK